MQMFSPEEALGVHPEQETSNLLVNILAIEPPTTDPLTTEILPGLLPVVIMTLGIGRIGL